MASRSKSNKRIVFVEAEKIASEFPLLSGNLPDFIREPGLKGILGEDEIKQRITKLRRLKVDDYIRETVAPSENPKRRSAPEIIRQLGGTMVHEVSEGPLYLAEMDFKYGGRRRRVVMLAQNRKSKNGVWMPRHHTRAAELMRFYSAHGIPVVTFMDTPGADAGEEANRQNQAHSISNLITEMSSLPLPAVGVVFGQGYSGGAIPLATTNVLLSVRDGVFNTIHPQGLSEIAYNYNLSWQECAKYIGVSSYELCQAGYLDAVVDYSPLEAESPKPLVDAIFTAIEAVEANAAEFLRDKKNHYFFEHYKENILHYLHPTELLIEENRVIDKTPTGRLNVFGAVYRFHRYLKLRRRLTSQSIVRYSRMVAPQVPAGDLQGRVERERIARLNRWMESPLEIRYDEQLSKRYKRMVDAEAALGQERNRITAFFLGTPEENHEKASRELAQELGLHLYNFWKVDARDNLVRLLSRLEDDKTAAEPPPAEEANLLDALRLKPVRSVIPEEVQNLVLFDLLYDKLVENLPLIARELKDTNYIEQRTMVDLLDKAFKEAATSMPSRLGDKEEAAAHPEFFAWLENLISRRDFERLMRQVSEWKRLAFPRLSEPLFGLLTYFFTHLLPSFYEAMRGEKHFDGRINPRNIGIKDFWNRLNRAYQDLLIQNLLADAKRKQPITPKMVVESLCKDFEERYDDLMSSDPVRFPGFRQSIERALQNKTPPAGVITGIGTFRHGEMESRVGLVVSNSQFQAGAFDMASGEKVCKLMVDCAVQGLPMVFVISSGGMQTKEGAGALFSMAVLNNRITRFVKDFDLPVICFGFRDCTGGAQASFVTHRLAKTFYLSGAVIPFAGQRVVPAHLPAEATLANYLSQVEGSMDGLVKNPFEPELDTRLREIDPTIPMPKESIQEVVGRVLQGEYRYRPAEEVEAAVLPKGFITFTPVRRLLVHARGCTAVRLIKGAHAYGADVVLVQSDADMESYAGRLLRESDRLVSLGGNTPQDSYLNGRSVIRIAEMENVDAVHPGIGFLSENPNFALLCRRHGLNFIGPRAVSMERMGNKSNAIATARSLNVAVVPGSQGVVTDPTGAKQIADEIGYPVLIKAAYGGGGKGMAVVYEAEKFRDTFVRTSQEAFSAFGNGDVYLEKFVESMRHVEVQVLRDSHGNTRILGMRDCSVQRDNQKLIEESGSYKFPKELQDALFASGEAIADEIDYIGAGTIEFIYDRKEDAVYFMEMNTRLQVEHPVTEMTTGVDIVREQLRVASGEAIADLKVQPKGYAMEVRINAERMVRASDDRVVFVPSPGRITKLTLPEVPNVRVINAFEEGDEIPPYYDSLALQIIAYGRTRNTVIKTLRGYLADLEIEGVYTNTALMEAILDDPVFKDGDYDTGFIKGFYERADLDAIVVRMEKRTGTAGGVIDQDAIRIENSEELKVLSPRTGVFYNSPTPDDPPFVEVGSVLDVEQPLCLLEAMKVFENLRLSDFNRNGLELFESARQFTVTRVLAESGQTVNQGDLLFIVKPVAEAQRPVASAG